MLRSNENRLRRKIKIAIIITILGLLLNGISAIPLISELNILLSKPDALPAFLRDWWVYVNKGVNETTRNYPFMRYGFDWLAFAHFLIAIAFIGPLKDPVKNEWIISWGMIASILSALMALGWERVRGIPLWWSCIDAAIAIAAFILLWFCSRWIQQLKKILITQ
ncbi:MAG: hypothetical protein ABI405_07495 [Parafilimonas sp.]